jgi:type II secretory ATPase GspE/PulE/Tfp pilus assembly ATPase PilB-like protein
MSTHNLTLFRRGYQAPNGIVLLTGPTGSGKTTTLYAAMAELNTPETNLVTVEDPVEYELTGTRRCRSTSRPSARSPTRCVRSCARTPTW